MANKSTITVNQIKTLLSDSINFEMNNGSFHKATEIKIQGPAFSHHIVKEDDVYFNVGPWIHG